LQRTGASVALRFPLAPGAERLYRYPEVEKSVNQDLRVTAAEGRIDRLTFNPEVEWSAHVVEVATYVCPWCSTSIQFNTGTLRQFERAKISPLGPDWARRCELVRPVAPWEWAADFRCAGCQSAVRIVYGPDGEYSMGAWKYRVHDIVEELSAGAG
jgi:hypothetical protein